jgi:hypothetical protein
MDNIRKIIMSIVTSLSEAFRLESKALEFVFITFHSQGKGEIQELRFRATDISLYRDAPRTKIFAGTNDIEITEEREREELPLQPVIIRFANQGLASQRAPCT